MFINTMEKPIIPHPEDCCNGGCSICVYDIYDNKLEDYQDWLRENSKE